MGVLTMSESPGLPPEAFSKGLFRLGFNAMGTRCEILYGASSVEHADPFRRDALAWVRRFEARYTRFREDSLIGRINAAAGKDAVEIDEEDARLFDLCETLHFHTEGLFDPTTLPLSLLWNFKADQPRIPEEADIQAARGKVGWKKVQRDGGSIRLPEEGMGLDFGGFGKEYAVDRVAELARQHGLENALIDFGGDVRALGHPPDSPVWRIGVEDPRQPGKARFLLGLSNHAVATSGNYLRFFEHEGKRYGHLLDHRTGYPASNACLSATVTCRSCLESGVLATCALLDGADDGLARLERFFGAEGCIRTDSGIKWTKRFNEQLIDDQKD